MNKQQLLYKALINVDNYVSKKTYKRGIDKFDEWSKKHNFKKTILTFDSREKEKLINRVKNYFAKKKKSETEMASRMKNGLIDRVLYVQAYANYLSNETYYTPETIHTYLCPVCKAYGIDMKLIKKPKRTAYQKVRSRTEGKNKQGQRELKNPKYQRLVGFAKAVGIRRGEYKKLKGRDLIKDELGYLCVEVMRGKGGRHQSQRILPQNINTVLKTFDGVKDDELVFSEKEMKNHIDLHALRAKLSYESYLYYEKRLAKEPEYRKQLIDELCLRWLVEHPDEDSSSELFKDFYMRIINPKPYIIRGDKKELYEKMSRSKKLNRLAVAASSAFHLAHWRLGICTNNYYENTNHFIR